MSQVIIAFANFMDRKFPALGKILWKTLYNFLAWFFPNPSWVFMNYGYAAGNADNILLGDLKPSGNIQGNPNGVVQGTTPVPVQAKLELAPEDEANRYFIQMYARVLNQVEVRDRDVLEVGCGRGGGSSWIARSQQVRSMTGLDLSKNAIRLCQQLHHHPALTYVQGDAEQLPFSDESFDAVLNVESCHHYPSMPKFIQEVTRVLRPNGYFWVIDYRNKEELEQLKLDLEHSDLELIQLMDITTNVVKALDQTESLKIELIQRHVPYFLLPLIKTFAAVQGTEVYQRFVDRELIYVEALLRKPL